MLTVRSGYGQRPFVRVGFRLQPGYSPTYIPAWDNSAIQDCDPISPILSGGYLRMGYYDLMSLTGLTDIRGVDQFRFSNEVDWFPPRLSGTYDSDVYGSYLQNIGTFLNVLEGKPSVPTASSAVGNERFARHSTIRGTATSKMHERESTRIVNFYDQSISCSCIADDIVSCAVFSAFDDVSAIYSLDTQNRWLNWWTPFGGSSFNIVPILDYFVKNGCSVVRNAPGPNALSSIKNFAYRLGSLSFSIEYDWSLSFRTWWDNGAHDYEFHVKITGFADDPLTPVAPWGSSTYSFLPCAHIRCEYSGTASDWGSVNSFDVINNIDWDNSQAHESGLGILANSNASNYAPLASGNVLYDLSVIDVNHVLSGYSRSIHSQIYDIVPAAYQSSTAAIENIRSSFDERVPSLLAKIYKLSDSALLFAENLRSVSIGLGRDYSQLHLHEVASALRYATPRSPDVRLALAFVTSWVEELLAASNLIDFSVNDYVGHGFYQTDLPGQFGRSSTHLSVHSKVVFSLSLTSLARALFGSESLTLLSQLLISRSGIPLGNVLSGFLGIRAKVVGVFDTIAFSNLDAYYVHSFTLSSPLSSDELDTWNVSAEPSNEPSLRVYWRDVSLFHPPFRQGKFDFSAPPSNSFDVGSILTRIILSTVRSQL